MKRKYHQIYDDMVFSMKLDGKSDSDIAKTFKISRDSFYKWLKKYESFKNAYEEARTTVTDVKRAMRKRAVGFEFEEEIAFLYHGKIVKGKVKKCSLPDTRAALFFIQREEFKNELEHRKKIDNEKLELEKEKIKFAQGTDDNMLHEVIIRDTTPLESGFDD